MFFKRSFCCFEVFSYVQSLGKEFLRKAKVDGSQVDICFLHGTCYVGIFLVYVNKGKYFSEVLIYLSINPQFDNRLFFELQVQYEKITGSEHVKNMSRTCYVHK